MQEQSQENRGGAKVRKRVGMYKNEKLYPRILAKGRYEGGKIQNALSGCLAFVGTVGRANFLVVGPPF